MRNVFRERIASRVRKQGSDCVLIQYRMLYRSLKQCANRELVVFACCRGIARDEAGYTTISGQVAAFQQRTAPVFTVFKNDFSCQTLTLLPKRPAKVTVRPLHKLF